MKKYELIGNVVVGKNVKILSGSIIENSEIKDNCVIGPNAYIRDNSVIGENSGIGFCVEICRTTIGKNVNIKHLSYIGDATIGDGTNIGAGVVFANYDGVKKHKTKIGKNVFIGSNSVIVSPKKLVDGTKVAAGTIVRKDVLQKGMIFNSVKNKIRTDR